jgi:hypothetical protein
MEGRTILVKRMPVWTSSLVFNGLPILRMTALGAALIVGSCASTKPDRESDAPKSLGHPVAISDPVNPGQCRLIATVLDIHAPDPGVGQGDPCATFPCAATVRIDSILGYGSGFRGALGPGQKLEVRFAYTLAPSQEAHPDAAFSLPGLSAGDRFQADLSGSEEMKAPGPGGVAVHYVVALYTKVR